MSTYTWIICAALVFLDQFSKNFVSQIVPPGDSIDIVNNIFSITLVHNAGAAFGIFRNQTAFFVVVSVLAIVSILTYIIRSGARNNFLRNTALSLVLGGAVGNLIDRLRFGYVIDFLDFKVWPVFNIADSAITIGAFLLIISLCTRYFSK